MEKFDVSYRLEGDERHSLVAQLVPYDRPSLPWDVNSPLPEGIRGLRLVCYLSDSVPGLIAWLTVRHHFASTGLHWRNGVFLRHPVAAYASEALLELRDRQSLDLEVRGPSPDLFFNELRDSIEDLIALRWPGIQYQMRVPCPTVTAGVACPGQFKLSSLLALRERGEANVICMECLERHSIAALISGFGPRHEFPRFDLDGLRGQQFDVGSSIRTLEVHAAETADAVRRAVRALNTEVTDCPRMFTLIARESEGLHRVRFWNIRYRLTLWCEHPGSWHSWPEASYDIHASKDWLRQIKPYARLMWEILRIVAPLSATTAAPAGAPMSEDQLQKEEAALERMGSLVEDLNLLSADIELGKPLNGLTAAEAAGLRALRRLLFEHDPTRSFGGLRRVQAPSGDLLWTCAIHYPLYDPGLPFIPDTDA